jgi:hypothetical protein
MSSRIECSNHMIALDGPECLRLLESTSIGRLGLTMRGLPWVVPVRFMLDGARILVDVGSDPAIVAATRDAVVAFETDGGGVPAEERWAVMATGFARPLERSSPGDGSDSDDAASGHVFGIDPEILTGWSPAIAT